MFRSLFLLSGVFVVRTESETYNSSNKINTPLETDFFQNLVFFSGSYDKCSGVYFYYQELSLCAPSLKHITPQFVTKTTQKFLLIPQITGVRVISEEYTSDVWSKRELKLNLRSILWFIGRSMYNLDSFRGKKRPSIALVLYKCLSKCPV